MYAAARLALPDLDRCAGVMALVVLASEAAHTLTVAPTYSE